MARLFLINKFYAHTTWCLLKCHVILSLLLNNASQTPRAYSRRMRWLLFRSLFVPRPTILFRICWIQFSTTFPNCLIWSISHQDQWFFRVRIDQQLMFLWYLSFIIEAFHYVRSQTILQRVLYCFALFWVSWSSRRMLNGIINLQYLGMIFQK
jgi:hypothetical protein